MPGPQLEQGYTRIANELLDAILRHGFNKREYAVLFAVIRKTYGWQKKQDAISRSQLARMIDLDLSNISRTINALVSRKVLTHGAPGKRNVRTLGINKNYAEWLSKQPQVVETTRVVLAPDQVPKQPQIRCQNGTHKRKYKENIKKGDNTQQVVKTTTKFKPPSVDDVRAYCITRHNSVNPQRFVDYYTANGWKVGRNPMKDWKAAVRTWESKDSQSNLEYRKSIMGD